MDDEALLTRKDVAERYSVHVDTVARMVKDGRIPPPVRKSSKREPRWLKSKIVSHIRSLDEAEAVEAKQ